MKFELFIITPVIDKKNGKNDVVDDDMSSCIEMF